MVRVLLQQNTVAHYRARLYECLKEQTGASYEFVADVKSDTSGLPTAGELGRGPEITVGQVWKLRLPGLPEFSLQPRAIARALLGEFDVAIALGSPYSLTSWLLLVLGPLVGTRVLLWTHGLLAPESGPKWWVRRLFYRLAAGLLLYGERAEQLLIEQGFEKSQLFVVKNSLDPERQARAETRLTSETRDTLRQRLALGPEDRMLVFIGRLQPLKRLDWIVRAVGRLKEGGQQVHAVLLGEGMERAELERLTEELGVTRLAHFEGAEYDEDVIAAYFALSDLCVIPSAAGLTVMHALGYGTPVLTHDRPELQFPEVEAIVPGETGILYREGDFESFVAALASALFPEPMKLRVAEACRARIAADYHPAVQAARMTEAAVQVSGEASH